MEKRDKEEGSEMIRRTLHKYAWRERGEREGVRSGERERRNCIDRFSSVDI